MHLGVRSVLIVEGSDLARLCTPALAAVIKAVVKAVIKAGARSVLIGEGSGAWLADISRSAGAAVLASSAFARLCRPALTAAVVRSRL